MHINSECLEYHWSQTRDRKERVQEQRRAPGSSSCSPFSLIQTTATKIFLGHLVKMSQLKRFDHDVIMMVFDPWLTPPSVFKWLFRQNVKMETGLTGWCQLVIVFAPLKGNSCWCYFVSGPTQPTVRGHKHEVTKKLFLVMIQWMNRPAPSSLLPASTLDSCQIME